MATGSSLDQECVESAGQRTRSAAFVAASTVRSTYGAALEPRVVTDGSSAWGSPNTTSVDRLKPGSRRLCT